MLITSWLKSIKLRSMDVIQHSGRSQALDFYRGLAILAVVFFHFGPVLKYGYIGVDLFFVISGYLVGGILVEKYRKGSIKFWKFFLKRGFKIWPSYYFFLFFGNAIAYYLYVDSNPDAYIPFNDLLRYLFFYRNYTGVPQHWNFDHVWSLCIEEHFYILFPIALMITLLMGRVSDKKIYVICALTIISGFVFKFLSLNFTGGQDTYSATHNRLDALAYGILLYMINQKLTKSFKWRKYIAAGGIILLGLFIAIQEYYSTLIYDKILFHSLLPLAFSLLILGTFFLDYSKLLVIRFMAYYSYNWYLWHPLLIFYIYNTIGINFTGFMVYLIASFLMAFISTIIVEEYFLKLRGSIFKRVK